MMMRVGHVKDASGFAVRESQVDGQPRRMGDTRVCDSFRSVEEILIDKREHGEWSIYRAVN